MLRVNKIFFYDFGDFFISLMILKLFHQLALRMVKPRKESRKILVIKDSREKIKVIHEESTE